MGWAELRFCFFCLTGNFSEITCQIKISPRDAQLAAEKFALRHRSRAKCVRAHTFLLYLQIDFIRSLEYTIVNECNCKVIYGEIMLEYLSIKQTSEKWGITVRRIQVLCTEGRIPGATKIGSYWAIPADAEKPKDQRVKSGKYMKKNGDING